MKKGLLILAALLSLSVCSCKQEERDPLKESISDKIKERNTGLDKLTISNLTVTDSVSLGDELDRRIVLFRTKVKAEKQMVERCLSKKAPTKAHEHRLKAEQAEAILEGLLQWKNSPSTNVDSTLYYIATFNASGSFFDGAQLNPTPMQASFDASGTIYNVQEAKGNIHTGMGTTIPGYKEFLKGFDVEDEGEPE